MTDTADLVALLQRLSDGAPRRLDAMESALLTTRDDAADAETQRMLADHGVQFSSDGGGTQLRIPGGLDVLNADEIQAALIRNGHRPRAVEVCWSIDSTNSSLMARARSERVDRVALLAEHQSAGRGRRGRSWLSPVACNLYISIGAAFARLEDTQALSLCTGVALADALGDLGYTGIGIKWPNDLHIDGRKLSGILIESGGFSAGGAANERLAMVIGIGVNVRVPGYVGEQIDQPWIDLAQAPNSAPERARPSRNRIAASIIGQVFAMLDSLHRGERDDWLRRFEAYDIARDRAVTLKLPDRDVSGIARGIDAAGELRVEVDGVVRPFSAGEVSLRVASNS